MKLTKALLALLMAVSVSQAFARPHRATHYSRPSNVSYSLTYSSGHPYYYGGYYYQRPWWNSGYYGYNNHGYHSGYNSTAVDVTCSPETMTKNSVGAEAVLNGLAQNEFATNEVFKQKVADLNQMTGAQKIEESFRLVGIQNPKDGKEVMNLIYGREISPTTIARVADNLKVSAEDAQFVVTVVTQVLKQR